MRMFMMLRFEDVSGVSGTGLVAEGVEFSDGTVVLHWTRTPYAVAFYPSMRDMLAVHGHDGKTQVQWLNGNDGNERGEEIWTETGGGATA